MLVISEFMDLYVSSYVAPFVFEYSLAKSSPDLSYLSRKTFERIIFDKSSSVVAE